MFFCKIIIILLSKHNMLYLEWKLCFSFALYEAGLSEVKLAHEKKYSFILQLHFLVYSTAVLDRLIILLVEWTRFAN